MNILIPWRTVVRRWSLWLAAAGGGLLAFFTWFPAQALRLWQALPPQIIAHVPKIAGWDVGLILIFMAKLAMFLDQRAVRARLASLRKMFAAFEVRGAVRARHAVAGGALAAALALAMPVIAQWEGERNDPYRDMANIRTVCFGHTGTDIQSRHYTDEDCLALLKADTLKHAEPVLRCSPQLADHVAMLAAMTVFNFNTGAYCASSIPHYVALKDYSGACAQLSRWVYVKGRRVEGLVHRRAAERQLCERGL